LSKKELPPLSVVYSESLPDDHEVTNEELALLNQFLPDLIKRVLVNTEED